MIRSGRTTIVRSPFSGSVHINTEQLSPNLDNSLEFTPRDVIMLTARTATVRRVPAGLCALVFLPLFSGCNQVAAWTMNQSGEGYFNRGNYAMANAEFARAALDDSTNADFQANAAIAMMRQGDSAGAEDAFRRALGVNPGHQPSWHGLAQLKLQQNRHEEAQQLLQSWVGSQPYVPEAHVEMAWLHRKLGDAEGAEQALRQALKLNPRHSVALAHMGRHYEEQGRVQEASRLYQQSLRSNWYQRDVQNRLTSMSRGRRPRVAAGGPAFGLAMAQTPRFGPAGTFVGGTPVAVSPAAPWTVAQGTHPVPPTAHASLPPWTVGGEDVVTGYGVPVSPDFNADPAHVRVVAGSSVVAPF